MADMQNPFGVIGTPDKNADTVHSYNTRLSPEAEQEFQAWATEKFGADGVDNAMSDYDMRGFFASRDKQAANDHFPDTFKKPNHPTFSNESKYSGQGDLQGGSWVETGGKWEFYPGPANLAHHTPEEIQNYLNKNDPDVTLVLPTAEQKLFPNSGMAP